MNLADHIEGAAGHDFGADVGIHHVIRLELGGDRLFQLVCRHAIGGDVADQGEGKDAIAIESVLASEGRLSEDRDAEAVVRAKLVTITRATAGRRRHRDDRRGVAVTRGQNKHCQKQASAFSGGDRGRERPQYTDSVY